MKFIKILTCMMVISLALCGCTHKIEQRQNADKKMLEHIMKGKHPLESDASEIPTEKVPEEEERGENTEMISQMNNSYWRLIKTGENTNFSPASLKYLMLLLQAAACDEEASRIGEYLGNVETKDAIKDSGDAIDMFEKEGAVKIANAVFADQSFTLKDTYPYAVEPLNTDVVSTNFESGKGQQDVNVWVTEKTNGLIKSFDVPEDTRTVLLNAIYFNDKWDLFAPEDTYDNVFQGESGDTLVPMMHCTINDTSITEGNTYRAMLFNMGSSQMVVYLPNEGASFEDVIAEINSGEEKNFEFYTKVFVEMPKFKFESKFNLNDFLAEEGFSVLFEGGDNTFCNLSNEALRIDSVMQKTTIEVSEEGVEASAVTGAVMKNSAMVSERMTSFNIDRPFLYEITSHGETLFVGGVSDISAQN